MGKPSEPVNICGVPATMTEHEGLVSFATESGFFGHKSVLSFVRKSGLWCLLDSRDSVTADVPVAHIIRCYELLCTRFGEEHKPSRFDCYESFRPGDGG